ncbi:MAG TPA: transketolase family protein [Candidatus Blautia avistercoris]|nr:transketolase family protein [Candidatus Blautia avistercoris]
MTETIRDAYGRKLKELGKKYPEIVVLDADVSGSTKSAIFGKEFPERFYNCGIAESAMIGMAAGMAASEKIPFVNTFAVFMATIGSMGARLYLSYSGLNVKLVGAYGGLSDSYDGATHQSLEDIGVMRALPGMITMVASDARVAEWMTEEAVKYPGPMYLRMSRDVFPTCHKEEQIYEIGKGIVLREGNDAAIIACGLMVSQAMKAAEELEQEGISVRVIDMFTIKPLDEELILKTACETGAVVTAEEHSIYGGLGSAVAETLVKNEVSVPTEMIGMKDCHGESGSYQELLHKYSLDKEALMKAVKTVTERKRQKEIS